MKIVKSKSEYLALIKNRDEALKRADHVRDLELDLYWKRAAYFWAFTAAAFAGYFSLAAVEKPSTDLLLIVSCLGTVFSFVWYLANRGGKYWHSNWEQQIDLLEDDESGPGPLYKTNIVVPQKEFWFPLSGYPFSVTKLNHLLSIFISLVWVVVIIRSAIEMGIGFGGKLTAAGIVLILTVIFLILLPVFGRSTKCDRVRKVDMEVREYEDK